MVDRYARSLRQALDGLHEVEVLDGPDEADGVTGSLASEAVVQALFGVHRERWCLLGMKRAQADPPPALAPQRDVLAGQAHQVGRRPHLCHGLVGDGHGLDGTVLLAASPPWDGLSPWLLP